MEAKTASIKYCGVENLSWCWKEEQGTVARNEKSHRIMICTTDSGQFSQIKLMIELNHLCNDIIHVCLVNHHKIPSQSKRTDEDW